MRYIDPHVHMTSRTNDYEAMRGVGVVAFMGPVTPSNRGIDVTDKPRSASSFISLHAPRKS